MGAKSTFKEKGRSIMVKKILSCLVCAAVTLSMTACGKNEYDTSSISGGSSSDKDDNTSAESNINDLFEKRTSMFEFLPAIDKPNSEDEFICEEVDGVGVKITGTTAQGKALWIPDKLYGKPVLGVNLPKAEFEEIIMPDTVQIFSVNYAKVKYMNIPRNIRYDHSTDGYDMPATNEIVLEAVYFDDGISEIKAMAAGKSLKRVSLPDSLTTLGKGAFATCSGLTNIVIPESVKSIDPTAFEDCENIRIKYGELIFTYDDRLNLSLECTCDENGISHTVFEKSAWGYYEEKTYDDNITYCSRKAEKITISANIKNISQNIFYYCDKLQSIEVDSENENYYSRDGVLFGIGLRDSNDVLLAYPNAKPDKKYTVPDNIYVYHSAIQNCFYLENIDVSDSNERYCSVDGVLYSKGKTELLVYPAGKRDNEYTVTAEQVYPGAFFGCKNLEVITITELTLRKFAVESETAGVMSFSGCTKLKQIKITGENNKYRSIDGVVFGENGAELIAYPPGKTDSNYTLPDSVTEGIYKPRLNGNTNLKTITYKGKTFSLNKLDELNDVIKYGENGVFIENAMLTGVSEYAEEIVIPDNVTDIVEYVFNGRDNIKTIKYKNKTYTLNDLENLFAAVRGEEGLTIVDGKLTAVSPELTEVRIPDRVTEIKQDYINTPSAFDDCNNLKKITFGKGVTSLKGEYSVRPYWFASVLGGYYGSGCTGVEEVIIPEGVVEVGDSAFAELPKLRSITLPSGLQSIGVGAFLNCTSLTKIAIPDSVTSISAPEVGSIASFPGSFDGCTNIKATYKGKTYDYAHIDDLYKAINGLTVEGNGLTIENGVVVSADKTITKAVIPQGVTAIGADSFSNCTELAEVIIPNTVTFIGAYAFNNCESLREVTLPDSVTECQIVRGGVREPHPFYNCPDIVITYKGKAYTDKYELYAAVNGN